MNDLKGLFDINVVCKGFVFFLIECVVNKSEEDREFNV